MSEPQQWDEAISWEDARATNLRNWEDRVPIHEEAYGLAAFDDPAHLSDVVATDLAALAPHLPGGSVAGLDLVHLQCHIGTDTVSLARAGARVVGVDFSPSALAAAGRLAARAGVEAAWVETDVLDAAAAVTAAGLGPFDVVYTSIGTICWLDDLGRWAAQVAALLRPRGVFYIRDSHPALMTIDEEADDLRVAYRYFADGTAQGWSQETSYEGDATLANPRHYEFPHALSEIVGALLGAGLRLEHLGEDTVLPWRFSKRMVEVDGGWAWPEPERTKVPATYTIVARRP